MTDRKTTLVPFVSNPGLQRAFEAGEQRLRVAFELLSGGGRVVVHPLKTASAAPALRRILRGAEPFVAHFEVAGGVIGRLALLLDTEAATRLAGSLLANVTPRQIDPAVARVQALTEAANIVASSFVSGIAATAQHRLLPSLPEVLRKEGALARLSLPAGDFLLSRFEIFQDDDLPPIAAVVALTLAEDGSSDPD